MRKLHNYQITGKDHIIENPFSGLFLDMGLGKTATTLEAIYTLIYADLEINKVLIIAPKRVVENVWTSEVKEWPHLKRLKLSRVIGTEKQRRNALAVKADIYLISRDNIAWLVGFYGGSKLPFDMLVIDESSSFKNHKSQRFKALKAVQPNFKRVVLLTGTPAPNGLIDIWPQVYLLDRGQRLGKTIGAYRELYFKPNQRNGAIVYNYKIIPSGEQEIHEKIKDICISMKAKDLLNLPGRVNNYIEIGFPEDLREKYLKFEEEQVLALFEDNEISAANAAALTNKLLQFTGGAVYDEEKNVHEIHALKLEELKNIIDEANGSPVLVAWNFKHERDRIIKYLKGYNVRQLKTDSDITDWNNGEIQVLLMHPASGGHGLNLQQGGHIITWYSPTWSLELYQQFNARLDRQGQKNIVLVHHLIMWHTIDEDVVRALNRKADTQDDLLRAVKARIDKYLKS
jgi:SNF2 family DNA or RNA helicase